MAKRGTKSQGFTKADDALLDELGVETPMAKAVTYTPREERVIAGFEEIQRFVEEHGYAPQHGEERDIFERLYAVRLDRIRASEECLTILADMDTQGLLSGQSADTGPEDIDAASDDELLEALGVEAVGDTRITQLKHVRSQAEIRAAEEVAQRTPCEDFDKYRPVFDLVQQELDRGDRRTSKYQDNAEVSVGDWFILDGQKVLVDRQGEGFVAEHGRKDRRLRVIYDNGTEADLLLRSLQRALNKDERSRRILASDNEAPPLFSDDENDDDTQSGYIYVLRSLSDNPFIADNREVIHKIGVTGGDVKKRIANAKKDPTYLLADVEVVETYKLANLNPKRLEKLLHQFFADARLDVELHDRFGGSVEPREWFLVPLPVIRKAIQMLIKGDIEGARYESAKADIVCDGKS